MILRRKQISLLCHLQLLLSAQAPHATLTAGVPRTWGRFSIGLLGAEAEASSLVTPGSAQPGGGGGAGARRRRIAGVN